MVPTGLVYTSERRKPLYYNKKWPTILGPKMSVIEKFHCMIQIMNALLTLFRIVDMLLEHSMYYEVTSENTGDTSKEIRYSQKLYCMCMISSLCHAIITSQHCLRAKTNYLAV